ncbi:MAG TPA: glycoside hydrolase family 13 protein, partial [Tepidisphaeraceae bacterium]|nr:glycoside hydrolase family 13 protein [Tepidisphaeraceae bacterium]
VWYQIFPERFRNANPYNDPGDFWSENHLPWRSDWWKTHPEHGEVPGEENFYRGAGNVWNRRYGGDIQGLREALPYLRELGINAIYLNPMFEADSMHKYDTTDFRHIDDNFGERDPGIAERKDELKKDRKYRPRGNQIFFELDGTPMPEGYVETDDPATWRWTKSDLIFLDFLKEARAQGFHVIIDGVFNHTGRAHPYFVDVLEKGRNSQFADWFEITDWGDPSNWRKMDDPMAVHGKPGGIRWPAWAGDAGHLPVFRKDAARGLAEGPYNHIMAVTQRWLDPDGDPTTRDGVDGWRLDVPGDIPMPFWIEWRKVVKAANPQAYTSGEIWTWAQPWLKGDQFDAVMNYQFAMPTQSFFVNERQAITASQYAKRLSALVFNYPLQVALVQQNLFDSHDTDRLASMFVNPDRPYDGANRIQDNGPDYNPRKPTDTEFTRMLQAIDAQMTFLGAPMLYYGTEAGMWSPDDPSNRQPMIWRDKLPYEDPQIQFNDKVFSHVQRLIALRARKDALRAGAYYPLLTDDAKRVFVFARQIDGQTVITAINRSDSPVEIEVPAADGTYRNWLDEKQAIVTFEDVESTSRPHIAPVGEATHRAADGKLKLSLGAWETAILSADDAGAAR